MEELAGVDAALSLPVVPAPSPPPLSAGDRRPLPVCVSQSAPTGICNTCGHELSKNEFSIAQWKGGPSRRKCMPCVDEQMQAEKTVPFIVGSMESAQSKNKKKSGRPRKAPGEVLIQGRTWRCKLLGRAEAPCELLLANALIASDVKKLAIRRPASNLGSSIGMAEWEVFCGLSSDKSTKQLEAVLFQGLEPRDWERVLETRHGDEWNRILSEPSFDVLLPEEDAREAVRRGLPNEMRVQESWREKHTPNIVSFEAGNVVMSPGGTHATRPISAGVATPDGEHLEMHVGEIRYDVPQLRGDAKHKAAARDAQREREERAILDLDPLAKALELEQRANAKRERRARLKALRSGREALVEQLLENASIIKPGTGLSRWERDIRTFESKSPEKEGARTRAGFFSSLRAQPALLSIGVPSTVDWLRNTLIPALQSYVGWLDANKDLLIDMDWGYAGNHCIHYATSSCEIPCRRLSELGAGPRIGRSREEDQAAMIVLGFNFSFGYAYPEYHMCPWLNDAQVEFYAKRIVQHMMDTHVEYGYPTLPTPSRFREYISQKDSHDIRLKTTPWTLDERVSEVVYSYMSLHGRNKLAPKEALALAAASAVYLNGELAKTGLIEAGSLSVGTSVTVFGVVLGALQHNGQRCTVVEFVEATRCYSVRLSLAPCNCIEVRRENLLVTGVEPGVPGDVEELSENELDEIEMEMRRNQPWLSFSDDEDASSGSDDD